MSEDELAVRLDWPERSTVPFRPTTEQVGASASSGSGDLAARVTRLEQTVDALSSEVARLQAELARFSLRSAPESETLRSVGPAASPARAKKTDRPRPIRVRSRSETSDGP